MTDRSEIVEWLRKAPSDEWCAPMLEKAADEIERLRAAKRRVLAIADERAKENVALRAALSFYAQAKVSSPTPGSNLSNCDDGAFARAALAALEHPGACRAHAKLSAQCSHALGLNQQRKNQDG